MDLLPYTSTHGHRHFITYQPNLMDGQTFYIHIKAVNRAGQQTVQVIGPVLVEVDAPTFLGDISLSVQQQDGVEYLIAEWDTLSFEANEVKDGLLYGISYAVGHLRGTDNVKRFVSLTQHISVPGLCTWTEPPTCVATPVDKLQWRLHGRHSYYVTLKLEGINHVERVVTSEVYEHYVGPPFDGIVVEIPVDTTEMLSEDIDHQSNPTQLHITWHDFHHFDQTINYQLAVGTDPGIEDVVGFTDVAGPSHMLTGLTLQPFQTYYSCIRARTQDGNTTSCSDGVTVLPVGTRLEGVGIYDAMLCSSDKPQTELSMSHHDFPLPNKSCVVDIDFQSSLTYVGIRWTLPINVTTYITNVKWGIQVRDTSAWQEFHEETDAGGVDHVIATNLHLEPGRQYRAVVQFCHPDGCFLPLYSDGVTVTPDAPVSNGFTSVSLTDTNLTFTWHQFVDPSIPSSASPGAAISRHEWTLLANMDEGHTGYLYPWRLITRDDADCAGVDDWLCSYTIRLKAPLETSSCLVVALRAYNKVNLYSTITRQLRGCDVSSKVTLTVIDAVSPKLNGNILLDKNALWRHADREYTPSVSTLSAVWPDLRHGTYAWKVVSDRAIHRFAFVEPRTAPDYGNFDCSAPEVLACGETQDNFVNVHGLPLREGQRYYICILANVNDLEFEKFTQHLEQNSECSNGIVVDTTPPTAGQVWVGSHLKHWRYQIDHSQLNIYWSSFVDVETFGLSSHHSGIFKYEFAVGTSPEGVDVRDYVDVGVSNMAVATGLTLQEGHTYYVTIRATDHVGRSTTATSPGVTIDSTPPDVTKVSIDVGSAYVTEHREVSPKWSGVFYDTESGIDKYYWCVGAKPGYCDILSYTETTEQESSSGPQDNIHLIDGHPVYVTVQAVNRVGLTAVTTSRAVIVDTTCPDAGHVYDVINAGQTNDSDYTTVASEIRAIWSGFHDPHSHITGYSVNIGKCPRCEDILEKSSVGLDTDIHLDHVTLERGVTYYTTVEACNGAGLCVSLTSDGVIADTSPPVLGDMLDGLSDKDIEHQSSRTTLSAHWLNFHDPESGLLYLEWRAGTTPGQSDILAPTRLHVTDRATTTLTDRLPVGKTVYVTLKVVNKAGLSSEVTSDGFVVDTTPPVTTSQMALDSRLGTLKANSQVWKSSLSVQWQMSDPESSVVEQFVSVTTRDSIHHNVPAVKLYGDVQEYTFSNVSLADGETYYAKVIACNGARLCTTSVSEGILIDGTAPVTGAFAVETEHRATLTRHRAGWMTYDDRTIRLAWLGFSDAHCPVTTYHLTVGRKLGSSDLLPADKPLVVAHTKDDPHRDEGFVQKQEFTITSSIRPNQQIFISLWAENKVGLVSSRLHGTFTAVPSQSAAGTLALVRRCQPVTCEGHCTCAPHGQLTCASTGGCIDVKDKPGFRRLSVYDIENYSVNPDTNTLDVDFTRSQCTLAATWRTTDTSGKAPERCEWSVDEQGQSMGGGLLDVLKEPLWREIGQRNMAIYTTGSSKNPDAILEPHKRYKVYVRMWYDANSYAVYTTDGVQTDKTPPELSRANKVTELRSGTTRGDVDFITSTSNVTLSWQGVFRDSHAGLAHYVASVSKTLGGRDVAEETLTSNVTQTCLRGLTMDSSDKYFSTVVAFNDAGLFKAAYSDGFKVDTTPPLTGHVWDGCGLADHDYSSDNRTVSAWWRGFSDDESYIDHYDWCVGTAPGKQDVVTCQDVGLHTRSTAELSSIVSSGTKLYSTVYAINGAGLKSAGVSSDGAVIDSIPPSPVHRFLLGNNLIKNPSFEEDSLQTVARKIVPKEWRGMGTVYLTSSSQGTTAPEGRQFVDIVSGHVKQTFATVTKAKYRVSFHVHTPDTGRFHSQQLGFVQLPGFHSAFVVQQKVATSTEWQKHVYYFIASDSSSAVVVGAVGHKTGFLLDNVVVQEVGLGNRSPSNDPRDPVSSHVQPMHVHVTSRGSYTAVTAAWDVEDPESPVTGHSWAIGTVRGGVQLQNFRSVGRQTHARADALLVQHGTELHVTVVVGNAAGLTTAIYSDARTIDFTSPELCCLIDGDSGKDVSYQTSRTLEIKWSVKDPESGVKYCEWAVGKSPGSQEVQPFTRTTSLSTASVALDASVRHGETVFSVVRCINYAGLQSTLVSSGVVMVTEPPDVSMATLYVISSSASYFSARDSHQSDRERLFFGWEGVRDKSGIAGYEVSIRRVTARSVLPWRRLTSANQQFVELQDLGLESYTTYTLMMRATNHAGRRSDVISRNFTIETDTPQIMNASVSSHWPKQWILNLDWTGVFLSNSSLFYEVNIGTVRGGIDVLNGLETERATLRITGVDHTKHHYVTLTAINKAGLYATSTHIVTYNPPSGTV
ncbi:hypothetical protein NP493_1549g00025 [Ridgeia piscesae]|uniref:Fibronectin type-III domain-containing protein n=1 Tax=Ridgeia piscesae TaxID=27915 RepID=A0AAD9NB08_RIDPI|nr:hypothetical protein NP493_1549g00025 [Ridgeia piscesae]